MKKNNPYYSLKKLFDTGNIEDFEELINGIGKTNLRKITGMNYSKVLRTVDEPDLFTLRNILKISKEIEVDPQKITALIFDTLHKQKKHKRI